ncbi:F0F1 ATP synthase subunit delta [Yoonia sp.]|uniref:F0F1 ATP synthase subunit delta n=1 Tax=Yoonia sp. TaxID=2212373 RepID=UPI003F6C012E
MQIDWLTVVAQIANFLVLVWLLQRFLYRPITDAMKQREEVIESRLAEARSARSKAEEEAEKLRDEQDALDASRDDILDKARQQAQDLRKKLEDDIRTEMENRRDTWREHLAQERDDFADTLRRRAGHQVIAIVGDMLESYAQTDLSDALATGFVNRIEDLDDKMRKTLSDAAANADGAALVETSMELPPAVRSKITRAVHKVCDTDIDTRYAQDADVVLGVRLTIGEQTLEWSAAQHLRQLDTALDEAIDSAGPAPTMQGG